MGKPWDRVCSEVSDQASDTSKRSQGRGGTITGYVTKTTTPPPMGRVCNEAMSNPIGVTKNKPRHTHGVGYVVLVGALGALTITATPMGRVCSEVIK